RDPALVAVVDEVSGRLTVAVRRPRARFVAHPRVFDLDHVGAEIAEQGAAERTGQDTGEIDHADAIERETCRRHAGHYTVLVRAPAANSVTACAPGRARLNPATSVGSDTRRCTGRPAPARSCCRTAQTFRPG